MPSGLKQNITAFLSFFFPFIDNSKNRRNWIKTKLSQIKAGESILDAGAGECAYGPLCSHLKYTSQDFGQYDGKGDQAGIQTGKWDYSKIDIISDIIKIPVPDASYDNILCSEVLEHISEPSLAIQEFSRILKKNGSLILTAPFCSLTHFAPFHFCSGFNRYWYETVLPKYGFTVKELVPNGNYFEYILVELFRMPMIMFKNSKVPFLTVLYLPLIIPAMVILWLCSLLSVNSDRLLCFGYHAVCVKNK